MAELPSQTSRRSFARLVGAGAALAALRAVAGGHSAVLGATTPAVVSTPPPPTATGVPGMVRLSANENPYGPPPAALAAMRDAFGLSNRYPDDGEDALRETLAGQHNVAAACVVLGAGSSQILHAAAAACAGPPATVVTADPTFEALGRYATVRGAKVLRVPLTADYRHDLPAMLRAAGASGLLYICNPNNPTASLTPAAELRALLDRVPPGVVVLVDEAYHHYAEGSAGYESVAPLVGTRPNLIVARTFSKIYGMAGLRCGYALASDGIAKRLREQTPWDNSNVMALAAARAALGESGHIERARVQNGAVRTWACGEVEKAGAKVIPSAANFFMADVGRDVGPVIKALHGHGVDVGRKFPALPTHLRVTVGTESEMRTFATAFAEAMAWAPAVS